MYHKKWMFLLSLVSIALGWNVLGQTFQLNLKSAEYVGDDFKLLSYNVRLFDKYNWTNDKNTANKIVDFIELENADLICLQEVPGGKINGMSYSKLLKPVLKGKNMHFASHGNSKTGKAGILTISKYPIIKKGEISFETSSNISIWTDIKINQDIIRVYNLHLQSIHLDPSNYKLLDTLDFSHKNRNLKEVGDILDHLKDAYKQRAKQSEQIAEHISKSPYIVIFCGDFNDQPVSYSYHNISANLCDAFIESGRGISNTYNGKFPSFRIDYILHSKEIRSTKYNVSYVKLSDHYPVSCKLVIN